VGGGLKQTDIETIYRTRRPADIPWVSIHPPDALVDLVESGKVSPCRAIDLGCGTGNYAIYLASRGFEMTGVDNSPSAIRIARENAAKRGIGCTFLVADVLGDIGGMQGRFGFAYDWELLHHIVPADREKYVRNVHSVLAAGGMYLSVCFSVSDSEFGGSGKFRKTPLGTVLYFSSEDELERLFAPYFGILELKTIRVPGKIAPHRAVYALMKKEG
jgi:SAM-dependent methyltransferase